MNFMIEYEKGVPDMCCERQGLSLAFTGWDDCRD